MTVAKKLEQYYPGDEAWYKFSALAKTEIEAAAFNTDGAILSRLKEHLKHHEDLAYVIYYFFYNDSLNWIERSIPILDDLKPIECLDSQALIHRLRASLLRTPL